MRKILGGVVRAATGEWILDRFFPSENGAGVVLARAIWSGGAGYVLLIVLLDWLGPKPAGLSVDHMRVLAVERAPLLVAVLGGAYASLYARFASQWAYLAGVYNQIKSAEVSGHAKSQPAELASWREAFIEDAIQVHLALKPIYATVIAGWWRSDPNLRREIESLGPKARARLMEIIEAATKRDLDENGPRA